MERGRGVGIVPTCHRAGLQMYGQIINITCILTRSEWGRKDELGMIRAVAGLCASGQRLVPASVDTSKVEQISIMAILSIPTIHPIGDGPVHGLAVVSI